MAKERSRQQQAGGEVFVAPVSTKHREQPPAPSFPLLLQQLFLLWESTAQNHRIIKSPELEASVAEYRASKTLSFGWQRERGTQPHQMPLSELQLCTSVAVSLNTSFIFPAWRDAPKPTHISLVLSS